MGAITAEVVDTGEKRDARGRRVTPTERRAQVVQAYRASGMTMAAFARRERINYATFAGWVAKAQRSSVVKRPFEFAELRMPFVAPPSVSGDQLEVRLPDGTVLRGGRVAGLFGCAHAGFQHAAGFVHEARPGIGVDLAAANWLRQKERIRTLLLVLVDLLKKKLVSGRFATTSRMRA